MPCIKCKKDLQPDFIWCPYCGKKQIATSSGSRSTKKRSSGTGNAYKRGSTWTARATIGYTVDKNGKHIPKRVTKGGFKSKTEALMYCTTLMENPYAPKSTESFYEVYERWREFYSPRVSDSTMESYVAAFGHFVELHHRTLSELKLAELQHCLDECDRGRSTRNNMRTVCSLVFKFAIQNGIVGSNPAEHLYCGSLKKGTRDAFTTQEIETIRQAVGVMPYADYVYCMIYTGFRPGEMLKLRKTAFDAENQCLVGGGKTKAGTDRIVTISPKILPIIQRLAATDGDYLFPKHGTDNPMNDEQFRRQAFEPLMLALRIDNRVPYSCRHTFANLMKAVQGSDTDKAALIGHADASMTKYYQSADYASIRAITDQI